MATTFYSQIAANRRNSLFLAAFVILVFGLLGFTIGYAVVGSPAGGVGATALALTAGAVSGIAHLLQRRQARADRERRPARRRDDGPPAPQRRPRDGRSRRTCRCPPSTSSTTPRRTRSPPGATRPHASVAITTGLLEKLDREELQGVLAPRDVPRPQLRHPLRAGRRRHGRGDRDPGRLLPAVHVLGRWPAIEQPGGWR